MTDSPWLRPYWIETHCRRFPDRHGGFGITAHSEADALALLAIAYDSAYVPDTIRVLADIRELDQNHVIPNMGVWFKRGIWYPRGLEYISEISN